MNIVKMKHVNTNNWNGNWNCVCFKLNKLILLHGFLQIFQLEHELSEALRAAGLPPKEQQMAQNLVIPAQSAPLQKIQPVAADNLSEISGSESDSPEMSPGKQ
jgi:hypothetical protein